jgi:hypothetical protein
LTLLGELTVAGYRLPIVRATFRYISDDGCGDCGWEFDIRTLPPVEEPDEASMLPYGVRFYSEADPIPLPHQEDLTGVEVFIEEPFDPVTGDVYFTLYAGEHEDVSSVRLRFDERQGTSYRLRVTALAYGFAESPLPLELECRITRLPDGSYVEVAPTEGESPEAGNDG